MEQKSIFDTLLGLPLFQGVTRERIAEVVGKARFHFLKYSPGEVILKPGQHISHLRFILSGKVTSTVSDSEGCLTVAQTIVGPDVILPDFLYGLVTHSPCTVTSITSSSVLQLEKADFLKILSMDEVFLINYLNNLSLEAQQSYRAAIQPESGTVEFRLAEKIVSLTQKTARNIVVTATLDGLCRILDTDPMTLQHALKALKTKGLINFDEHKIEVIDRLGLSSFLFSSSLL